MNRIKVVLEEQGRTQVWLSKQIGKSYVVVTNYCNNNKQPSIPTLYEIANILDIDARDLLISSKPLLKDETKQRHDIHGTGY